MEHQGGAIDLPVGGEIEGLRLQHIGDAADGIGVQQDPAQHGFLGLEVLGGHAIGHRLEAFVLPRSAPGRRATAAALIGVALAQGNAHHCFGRGFNEKAASPVGA